MSKAFLANPPAARPASRSPEPLRALEGGQKDSFRAVVEATPECVKMVSRDGALLQMNEAGLRMVGAPDFNAVSGACVFELIAPEHRDAWRAQHCRVCDGESLSWEFDIISLQGARRHMETHAVPLRLPSAPDSVQLAVTRDITDRKRAEAEQARNADQLREQTRRLETLNRIGAALAAELDLTRIVQMVTDAGVEITGAAFGAFFYNVDDAEGERLTLYTLSGAPREAFAAYPMPRATAIFHPTFTDAGPIRSDDITQDPRYGKSPPHFGMPQGHLPVRSYLAVSVVSRSGEVLGGLFFGHPEPGVFTAGAETLLIGIAGQAAVAIDNARLFGAAEREIEERKRAERRQKLLIDELNHRVKNTLASVQSIAAQTLRNAPSLPAAQGAFEARLMALSRAHNLLTDAHWEAAGLHAVAAAALSPHCSDGDARCRVSGPEITLTPSRALALSMAFHELATNAAKYGALSAPGGRVELSWRAAEAEAGERLQIVWTETGGPAVQPPARKGFGSRLLERALSQELGGQVRLDYAPAGVTCTVDMPMARPPQMPESELADARPQG